MRHGTSSRRQRSRNSGNGGRRNNQQRTQVYDSNGPDVRIRGTAHQVAEKYLALAKDAASTGDRIVAENYYQHAEHYIRIINDNNGKFDANKILGKSSSSAEGNSTKKGASESNEAEDLSLPKSILDPSLSAKDEAKKVEEEVAV